MNGVVSHWYAFCDHSLAIADLQFDLVCPRGAVSCPQICQAFGQHLVGRRMKCRVSMDICGGHEVVAAYSCSLGG